MLVYVAPRVTRTPCGPHVTHSLEDDHGTLILIAGSVQSSKADFVEKKGLPKARGAQQSVSHASVILEQQRRTTSRLCNARFSRELLGP